MGPAATVRILIHDIAGRQYKRESWELNGPKHNTLSLPFDIAEEPERPVGKGQRIIQCFSHVLLANGPRGTCSKCQAIIQYFSLFYSQIGIVRLALKIKVLSNVSCECFKQMVFVGPVSKGKLSSYVICMLASNRPWWDLLPKAK